MFATYEFSMLKETFNHLFKQDAFQVPISGKTLFIAWRHRSTAVNPGLENLWTQDKTQKDKDKLTFATRYVGLAKACANVENYADGKLLNFSMIKYTF